jgi:putative acetyltransferase
VLVRRFRLGDAHALWRVFHSAIHLIAARDYTSDQIRAWAPEDIDPTLWRQRMEAINPFVVERDGQIVGYADLQPTGYIDHFFVSGCHPRQGIGGLLMATLHNEARDHEVGELTSDVSLTAQPFFARHGFVVVEHRTPLQRGVVVPNARMRKTLSKAVEA